MNDYKAPKDKMDCIATFYDSLIRSIENSKINSGNDMLLPLVVISIIQGDPSNFISNLKYEFQRFFFLMKRHFFSRLFS